MQPHYQQAVKRSFDVNQLKQDFQHILLGVNGGESFSLKFVNSIFDQIYEVPIVRLTNHNQLQKGLSTSESEFSNVVPRQSSLVGQSQGYSG